MPDEIWTTVQYRAYLAGRPPVQTAVGQAATPPPADRYRSKTERRYAESVLAVAVASGEILAWWYEPQKGLWLAPKTSYTPDFLVQHSDPTRRLEFHEVKGPQVWPQDWQKLKAAAARYPCYRFLRVQWRDGRWWWKEVPSM